MSTTPCGDCTRAAVSAECHHNDTTKTTFMSRYLEPGTVSESAFPNSCHILPLGRHAILIRRVTKSNVRMQESSVPV